MALSSDEGLLVVILSAYTPPSASMFIPDQKDYRQNKRKEDVMRQMASERMATDYSTMALQQLQRGQFNFTKPKQLTMLQTEMTKSDI